ncbi:MAG: helix-turn-helix domain-containing protein [Blautia sp.]|nr:helix-turn-helix domain-containing protein [Blautia sp.]
MTLGEKIYKLRSEMGLSQEAFGERLGVSRQSVSKWETDQSLPELEKIVAISSVFGVSTDYLLKEEAGRESFFTERSETVEDTSFRARRPHYEYKSQKTIKGIPLVHVRFGIGMYRARGILAIGNRAEGVIAIGFLSAGVVSIGLLSAGVLALGTIAVGLMAFGSFAAGIIAFGAFSFGIFCMGACNFGEFCFGALSYGRQVAVGDEAHGRIAIGFSRAVGEVYEEVIGKDYQFDYPTIEKVINENVSSHWFPFRSWIKGLLRMLAR